MKSAVHPRTCRRVGPKIVLAAALVVGSFGVARGAMAQKGGVIRLEETVIEGRVQKPNAFFINTRQALVYEGMEIKESFVTEISKSVANGPF